MIATQFLRNVELKRDNKESQNKFPFYLPAIESLTKLDFHPKVTFFVGENGSGKSTLLEAIAIAMGFNAEGGSKNFRFSTHDSHSSLHEHLKLTKGFKIPSDGFFLRAESFYNVATQVKNLDVNDSYGGDLHSKSHGESFMALVMNRFRGNGLYLLDEPEAALSPQRQLALMSRIHDLIETKSQFIIATHSPILMAYPDAKIYEFSSQVNQVEYKETEHFQITRDFLNNPERILRSLFGEEYRGLN